MKIVQISAGRDRSVVLASDGSAHGWGGIKRLGATLPPGYPGELCLSSPTEIGHNRYAQPVPKLNHSKAIPDLRTPIAGLYFASMSQVYPWDRGTNFAVEIGRRVARLALADVDGGRVSGRGGNDR